MQGLHVNIGQQVQGSVNADTLILNIGGQVRQLVELTDEQVNHLWATTGQSIRLRQRVLDCVRFAWGIVILLLIRYVPGLLTAVPGQAETSNQEHAAAMLLVAITLAGYFFYRIQFGTWTRRQKRVIRELERVLDKVDAERDLRERTRPMNMRAMIGKVISILRD